MPESGFSNFLNFFAIFFQNFPAEVKYKRNSGLKFFSPTLGLSHPVLARNIAEKRFFECFCYFFRNFLARVGYERNSGRIFFCLFLGQSHPVWARNNARKSFFNFLNFLAIFFRILFHGSSMNGILA